MAENPHLKPFTTFLEKQTEYKTMTLDQWQGLGRFILEVILLLRLLEQYSIAGAYRCPSLLVSRGFMGFSTGFMITALV
jgi:hypothetical protein